MATRTKTKPPEPVTEPQTPAPDVEAPDPKAAEPAIRVSTKRTRPTIEIDGVLYEMRTLGDFGIGRQQGLNRDGQEFYRLWSSETELSDAQGKRLKFLLERMYEQVLDAPKGVLRKLNDAEKADVVLTFTLAPLRQAMMAAALARAQEDQTETVESQDQPSISTS